MRDLQNFLKCYCVCSLIGLCVGMPVGIIYGSVNGMYLPPIKFKRRDSKPKLPVNKFFNASCLKYPLLINMALNVISLLCTILLLKKQELIRNKFIRALIFIHIPFFTSTLTSCLLNFILSFKLVTYWKSLSSSK